ncbi:MAG TPA: hypothetical protein VF021_04280 [Longimicrobiales bacterium]
MKTSGPSHPSSPDSGSDQPAPKKPFVFVPPRQRGHGGAPQAPKPARGPSAGRQAYTVHVARHDRQHHRPGK